MPLTSFSQDYGLEFAGKPVSKDERTSLALFPEDYFHFRSEFELSFSIQIRDRSPGTFGYVARIVDDEGKNMDIIFDGPNSHSMHVVYNPSLSKISVLTEDMGIYEKWIGIRFRYDSRNRTLQFCTPDTTILRREVVFSKKIKIFFGRNDFENIKTTDVPRMNIKDIKVCRDGRCPHHFPLDEMEGNEAKDMVSRKSAAVENPGWIKPRYYYWGHSFDTFLKGYATVCYQTGSERVYMVGNEQMRIFSILKDSIETVVYSARFQDLIPGSRVFFDTITNRLICYSIKTRTVHYFDYSDRRWKKISGGPEVLERFWFHNSYYSETDSLLYIFGGYSQHRYSNLVQRYNFAFDRWDTVQHRGDDFHPRMHAAIGSGRDTLYIMGGFGSRTGDQTLNPEHYTDLLAFSLKDREFLKKYEFRAPLEDLDFAHSMIVDEGVRSYYVLATTIFEYETYLQLLKGSLDDPELELLGNKIPYLFHNEYSYCDLFYSEASRELIALTSLADSEKNESKISVYKIAFPPFESDLEAVKNGNYFGRIFFAALFLLVVAVVAIVLLWNRSKRGKNTTLPIVVRGEEKIVHEPASQDNRLPGNPIKSANSILFFGGFQVLNRHGVDITKKFAPLLKELFLLIFLHSIKDKGISVTKLTETLWFSMDAKTAKNNRAVNIAKLKNLLSEIEGCTLSRRTGYWQIIFDDSIVFNDYWACMKSADREDQLSKEDLLHFLAIIKKGPLLENAAYEWLDEFKLECSNSLIDSLTRYVDQERMATEPELMIRLADAILLFDMMHEEAISIKCKALTALGKHSLAKETFFKFSNDYRTLYDEPFGRSFRDIIRNSTG